MTEALDSNSTIVAAINEKFPDNEEHGTLCLMYAQAYQENPEVFMGMLAASIHVMHNELRDIYQFLAPIAMTIQPIMADPQAFMDSIEVAVKKKFPALSLMG